MKKLAFPVGAFLALGIVVFGAWSYAFATQNGANKPLGLYDANDVFIGDLVSAHFGSPQSGQAGQISYTAHIQSVDGIIQFNFDQTTLRLQLAKIFYPQTGCQGQPYLFLNETPLISNWLVVNGVNSVFRAGYPAVFPTALSHREQSGECIDEFSDQITAVTLTPVTLPFNVADLTPPFSVR